MKSCPWCGVDFEPRGGEICCSIKCAVADGKREAARIHGPSQPHRIHEALAELKAINKARLRGGS